MAVLALELNMFLESPPLTFFPNPLERLKFKKVLVPSFGEIANEHFLGD